MIQRLRRGSTLVELNVAILILAIGLAALLAGFPLAYQLLLDSRNTTQAMVDAGVVLDQIRSKTEQMHPTGGFNVGFYEVSSWNAQDWADWFAGLGLPMQNLKAEAVQIIPGNVTSGLLPLSVQVQWQTASGKIRRITVEALVTNRSP